MPSPDLKAWHNRRCALPTLQNSNGLCLLSEKIEKYSKSSSSLSRAPSSDLVCSLPRGDFLTAAGAALIYFASLDSGEFATLFLASLD
jgi:hypothetical protein